ncbi:hypothetical protein C0995_006825 [Termitomyces sp. Mi166|nr:hypothetical protein C0995_006825 [Termitomyces sp. Mi166\
MHEEVHAVSSALPPTQEQHSQQVAPCNKSKGKVKETEEDEDKEGEAAQELRKELEDFVVLTKPSEYYEGDIGLPQGAKILDGRQGDIMLVSPAMRVLVLEKNGDDAEELVDSDSDKKEKRVHIIKKIKCEHIEEPASARKEKKIIELEDLKETVAPKTPTAGPLHQTLKPVVLVPSVLKPIPKPIVVLASPVAGPSTAQMVPSSAPKPAATTSVSKPVPVQSAYKRTSSL